MNAPVTFPETISVARLDDAAERARIERFVAEQGGSPFHTPRWLAATERGTGQRGLGLVAERGGAITGWLPLTEVVSPLFPRALVSTGFAVDGGPLAKSDNTSRRLCKAGVELAGRTGCSSVEVRGGAFPDGWHVRSDTNCGFVGPLAEDDEAQLLAIPRKQRAEVRKGLANGLDVAVGSEEADRAAHYACYAESVRNLGTPVFPRSLFDAVLDSFGEDADILSVRREGAPVASVLSLYHGGAVMPYWGGGTLEARHLRANEVMYYALMCHARERGCTRFDFGRSKTGSGPYRFKKNWGFEPQPLTYATWTAPGAASRDLDPTSDAYARKIALWKKLPLGIANRLGPPIAKGLA